MRKIEPRPREIRRHPVLDSLWVTAVIVWVFETFTRVDDAISGRSKKRQLALLNYGVNTLHLRLTPEGYESALKMLADNKSK